METASSLVKALDTLTVLAGQSNGIPLPELVRAMNQPRSNVVHTVNTLKQYGLIESRGHLLLLTPAFHDWARPGRHSAAR